MLCRLLLSDDRNSLRAVLTDWCLEVLLMITGDVIESILSMIVPVSNVWADINKPNEDVRSVADISVWCEVGW